VIETEQFFWTCSKFHEKGRSLRKTNERLELSTHLYLEQSICVIIVGIYLYRKFCVSIDGVVRDRAPLTMESGIAYPYIHTNERSGGLVRNALDFGPGDPGSITSLCVTLCFLSHRIRVLNKERPSAE